MVISEADERRLELKQEVERIFFRNEWNNGYVFEFLIDLIVENEQRIKKLEDLKS